MKITVLMENTTTMPEMLTEHGLSLYIETNTHKILFDTGQTGAFAENAQKLGVDLSLVDVAVLSHGHYDHGGGLTKFLEINDRAAIYLSQHAFEPHYSGKEKYVGLNTKLQESRALVSVGEQLKIDDTLMLYACNECGRAYPMDNFGLNMFSDGKLVPEDFRHEQYLMICDEGKRVLISGCSHKGILNIMSWFAPDVLLGGFHFMKLDPEGEGRVTLENAAEILSGYETTYYTGHCTGVQPFDFLKDRMGEKLHYMSTGMTFII